MDEAERARLSRLAGQREVLLVDMTLAQARTIALPVSKGGILYVPSGTPASALFQYCYDDSWVDPDLDWLSWSQSEECANLTDYPSALQSAAPDQLSRLLTMLVRQDRFTFGAWSEAVQSGILLAIVSRAGVLAN